MDELRNREPHGDPSDPPRDRDLSGLLEAAEARVSASALESVDWADLHVRIVHAADAPLAARRSARETWWSPIASWSPIALPVGTLAAVALAIGLGLSPSNARVAVEDVVASSAQDTPSGALLFASSPEAFATAALGEPAEDR